MSTAKAKLRLASRITTLEDMEASQLRQTNHSPQYRPRTPEKSLGPVAKLSKEHFHTAQILYQKDVYRNYPQWKRWIVEYAYVPLFRQFHKRLKLFPPTRMEPDGTYSWLMHQGCFETEEEANADAARYPHGYVVPHVPVGRSLTSDVNVDSTIYVPSKSDMETGLREQREVEAMIAKVEQITDKLSRSASL